jgi:hypothetical protein
MKLNRITSLATATAIATTSVQSAVIGITDYTLVPDGTNFVSTNANLPAAQDAANTNIQTANGNQTIVNAAFPVAYIVSTFSFGTGTLADIRINFSASVGQDRLGFRITDNGIASGTGDGNDNSIDFDFDGAGTNPASTMAGQTITVIGKFEFDATYSTTYGRTNVSEDSFATFWINPTGSDTEGSGRPNGADGVANANFTGVFASNLWNSSSFVLLEQRIFNNSTPGTAGASTIGNTTVITGTDATFANALALATIPEPSSALLGGLGLLALLRRRRA